MLKLSYCKRFAKDTISLLFLLLLLFVDVVLAVERCYIVSI